MPFLNERQVEEFVATIDRIRAQKIAEMPPRVPVYLRLPVPTKEQHAQQP